CVTPLTGSGSLVDVTITDCPPLIAVRLAAVSVILWVWFPTLLVVYVAPVADGLVRSAVSTHTVWVCDALFVDVDSTPAQLPPSSLLDEQPTTGITSSRVVPRVSSSRRVNMGSSTSEETRAAGALGRNRGMEHSVPPSR